MDYESTGGGLISPTRLELKHRASSLYTDISADFAQAEAQFERILNLEPSRIDDIDVYSNILYVTENQLKLSRLAHELLALDKDRPEVCCVVGM